MAAFCPSVTRKDIETMRARVFRAASIFAATLLSGTIGSAAAFDRGSVGGDGGLPFRENCKPGTVLIGLDLNYDGALQRFQPICYNLNAERTDWAPSGMDYLDGAGGGSSRGLKTTLACDRGSSVQRLRVWLTKDKVVQRVSLRCASLSDPRARHDKSDQVGGGEPAVGMGYVNCLEGEFATGVYGMAQSKVYQIGLQCNKLPDRANPTANTDIEVLSWPNSGQVIGTMPAGSSGKVLQRQDGWCKLQGVVNGVDGWVPQGSVGGC